MRLVGFKGRNMAIQIIKEIISRLEAVINQTEMSDPIGKIGLLTMCNSP